MAAIYTVNDGDDAVAADLNQLVNALNNVLGITDTAQVALGRLVLPVSLLAAVPGSPVVGQMYMTTDEGASGGRLYVKHTTDLVPYLPIRQRVVSSELSSTVTITSTSFVDSGISVSIVTTGGRLRIYLLGPALSSFGDAAGVKVSANSNNIAITSQLIAVVGVTVLGGIGIEIDGDISANWVLKIPPGSFQWDYQPSPGSYTVKIQGRAGTNDELEISAGVKLVVEEWGD